ncbi:unknown protein [Cronobacter turicensis z3032]|uniref:Uncharacterized protein n=1 Tax=Cronobacter turicensis (strain DSM 18703 / CCUG 55852 / LMG 23827 / z3032) TaxID=693216 RepID=C9XXN6_CROTZ|nr:unknown protein [Cronobacter turicensis z3032]
MRFMVFYVTQFLTVNLISTDVKQSINVNTGIQEYRNTGIQEYRNTGMVQDYKDSQFCLFNDVLKIMLIKL